MCPAATHCDSHGLPVPRKSTSTMKPCSSIAAAASFGFLGAFGAHQMQAPCPFITLLRFG
ncbi:hypothetical protein SALB_00709 [Streptomyces noursei]|uniref:Uncharacterized protein n=1 Tax=Streptomyces noursei TaxID=1971 RepID=A0A401QRL7_STRNR|nr:hypothetical protein SALB_00709 [Streptomyces noursei]